jgi:pseudouridine-5'-phosphate glycosidase
MDKLPSAYRLAPNITRALQINSPIVALETTVITHGLPDPKNLELARDMEQQIHDCGALPATIGVLDGSICVGMSLQDISQLAKSEPLHKISRRDFATAISSRESGGTTVAGTMFAAHTVGIRVLATGGIGGVHRGAEFDVSADLQALSQIPMMVVCAGAKAILDLPATLEVLETLNVPVVGYQTDEFPAFYARTSGLPVGVRVDTPRQVTKIARAHWDLGMSSAVLVVVPPPAEVALSESELQTAIEQAVSEAHDRGLRGQQVTPFLLDRVNKLTGQASLKANLALLLNNAKVAAQIATQYHRGKSHANV